MNATTSIDGNAHQSPPSTTGEVGGSLVVMFLVFGILLGLAEWLSRR
jgi:hypothetical protein